MKKSQIAVTAAFGFMMSMVVIVIVLGRIAAAQLESSELSTSESARSVDLSKKIELKGFQIIDVRGVWRVIVSQGEHWQVNLAYPDGYKDRLRVRLEGNRLVLDVKTRFWDAWSYKNSMPPTARIVMPELQALNVAGAGMAEFSGFSGDSLVISGSGATKIDGADGHYDQLDLTMRGAVDVDLRSIIVVDAQIKGSGIGNVTLTMGGGVLSGKISGVGNVTYYGSVSEQRIDVSGIGNIRNAGGRQPNLEKEKG